ncbi:MAG: diguanylate cyclase [Burkholderiales bacterium]|jgi:diguanylate cyclase (GGDEF)-like protein
MHKNNWLTSLIPRKSPIGAELGQAKFRVLNVSSFCSYLILAWFFKWQAVPASVAVGALGYIAYSLLWVFVVRFSIIDVTLRRTLAAILDQALPALGMYLAGSLAGLVAWVPALGSIGGGLRFGTRYTWLSSAVGGPLMGIAFFLSPDWNSIPGVAAGIVLANVLLPLYVVALVKRIEHDKQTFELRAAHFEAATKHDSLTGLLNRAGFADVFEELLASDTEQREMSAVLLLDLDGFKAVNDAFGHAAGDDVLKAVASSLTGCLRRSDNVARLGGDEFGVLIRHINNDKNVESLAGKVLGAITQVDTPRDDLRLGVSIGVCVLPQPGLDSFEDVLKAADRLMYEAKAAGKNQFRMLRCEHIPHPITE